MSGTLDFFHHDRVPMAAFAAIVGDMPVRHAVRADSRERGFLLFR